jgi:protein-L-isoaspartate(D-aspartate) O-methyltransferase
MQICDEFEIQRRAMVEHQLRAYGRDIDHPGVLQAMARTPRHEFVPFQMRAGAYSDHPLPIGHGQTISQPYIVAFMTATLDPHPGDRVLEIGTGCGYQAAVLAQLVSEVYSVEIVEELAAQAAATLQRLEYSNVHVRHGDGARGWPEEAPFDAILVACAPRHIPKTLTTQLTPRGRMIVPVGTRDRQNLVLLRNTPQGLRRAEILPVTFVPMTSAVH